MIKRCIVVAGWVVFSFGLGSFIGLSASAAVLWALGVLAI
jgi:hypothetical protein